MVSVLAASIGRAGREEGQVSMAFSAPSWRFCHFSHFYIEKGQEEGSLL